MLNMQYELAHERSGEAHRIAQRARDAHRVASAARWRRIEHAVAAAHERAARLARVANEASREG
jgi:hypothetical protein